MRLLTRPWLALRYFAGRHLSVRAKLMLWYGAMVALTLAVVGFGMLYYAESELRSSIDSGLPNTAAKIEVKLAKPVPTMRHRFSAAITRLQHMSCVDTYDAVRTYCLHAQDILTSSAGSLSGPGQFEQLVMIIPTISPTGTAGRTGSATIDRQGQQSLVRGVYTSTLLAVASSKQPTYRTVKSSGQTLRIFLRPLAVPPALQRLGVSGVLEVFQNEHTYLNIEDTFLITLIVAIPLGLIIALLAGWWIARAALRPIGRISRTVRAIGESRDLSRRLRFVGPQDEVGRLAQTFDGMMDRLENVFEAQKRFIGDASHELRTPLTAIRGNAELMSRAPEEERDVCLASIRREAERMSRLVNDLLLLAESDVAEQEIDRRDVDLDELIADVFRSGQIVSAGKVHLVLAETEPLCVVGDTDRLKQLFLNLVDNAVKFTPEGGTVAINLRQEDDEAVIEVADSGVGIAAKEQAAIFERFYRVEQSRQKRGHGLGLSISAWIVRAHGGSIAVSSRPGQGSTFTVRLPLKRSSIREKKDHRPEEAASTPKRR